MSEIQPELLVTVVHGTWPRGLFPKIVQFKQWVRGLMRRKRLPSFWFEEGSSFLDRLSTELGDIPHKITPLLWSGANSIFVRDKTAQVLAEYLAAENAKYPQATQLVIAHSHGGNIALRTFFHLMNRSAPHNATPFVVTLATPFVEIHRANFGSRPLYIRWAMIFVVWFFLYWLGLGLVVSILLFFSVPFWYAFPIGMIYSCISVIPLLLLSSWWIYRRATYRHNQLDALQNATRLCGYVPAQRLLVIRAIDDEATLTMAVGTIFNYVTARFIVFTLMLFGVLVIAIPLIAPPPSPAFTAFSIGFAVLTILLLGALMLARLVHGRELAVSPLECQINTQSAPDAVNLSEIVTLVSHAYAKSLRHGIYSHEKCAKAISDWVRSQIGRPLTR